MADVIDLETPPPTPPEPPPPAAVPEPPADPDEVGAIEVQGGKHVPLEALKQVRAELKATKEQAARAASLEQELAQARGSLQTYEQLRTQLQPPTPPPTTVAPDPELEELARSLDYYDKNGQPDLARADKHAKLVRAEAMEIAQQLVQPIQQQTAQAVSRANLQQALSVKAPNGAQADPNLINQMWASLPAEYTADPRVANILPALALGLQSWGQHASKLPAQPAPPAAPPLHTEGIGVTQPRRVAITEAERRVLETKGMTEKKYEDLTKGFVKGKTNQLED